LPFFISFIANIARKRPELNRDKTKRGYAVSEVAERLGISTKSLYTWKAQFAKSPHERAEVLDQAAEIRRLKRELARVTEERTILKKATTYFARESQ
jgi:transposase